MNDPIKTKKPLKELHVAPILATMALVVSIYVLVEHEHPADISTFEIDRIVETSKAACEPWGGAAMINVNTKTVNCVNGFKVDVSIDTQHYVNRDYQRSLGEMDAAQKKADSIQKIMSSSSSASSSAASSEWPKNVPVPSNKIFH